MLNLNSTKEVTPLDREVRKLILSDVSKLSTKELLKVLQSNTNCMECKICDTTLVGMKRDIQSLSCIDCMLLYYRMRAKTILQGEKI